MRTGELNLQQFIDQIAGTARSSGGGPSKIPTIRFLDCTFRTVLVDGALRQPREKHIDMTVSRAGPETCLIAFDEQSPAAPHATLAGSLVVNMRTGVIQVKHGTLPIEDAVFALPGPYVQWRDLYSVKGTIRLLDQSTDPSAGAWNLSLEDASMTLPQWQGGLRLDRVSGKLQVSKAGIVIRQLHGRIRQAGDAWCDLKGHYDGFDSNSPFHVEVKIDGFQVPDNEQHSPGPCG